MAKQDAPIVEPLLYYGKRPILENYFRWFSPSLKDTQIRSKALLAARLCIMGPRTIPELKQVSVLATSKLLEPRSDEEAEFLEDLASRILQDELMESESLVDRMVALAHKSQEGKANVDK